MTKFDSLELVDYSGISRAISDLGSVGSEKEFNDGYFPRLVTNKISHLHPEDLEVENLEEYGSNPIATDNAILSAGICIFSLPLSYYKNFMISD